MKAQKKFLLNQHQNGQSSEVEYYPKVGEVREPNKGPSLRIHLPQIMKMCH